MLADHAYMYQSITAECEWLRHVNLTADVVSDEVVSWSAYHASQNGGPTVHVSVTSLMPHPQESAHSVATIKHSMDKIKATHFFEPWTNTCHGGRPALICISKANSMAMAKYIW